MPMLLPKLPLVGPGAPASSSSPTAPLEPQYTHQSVVRGGGAVGDARGPRHEPAAVGAADVDGAGVECGVLVHEEPGVRVDARAAHLLCRGKAGLDWSQAIIEGYLDCTQKIN